MEADISPLLPVLDTAFLTPPSFLSYNLITDARDTIQLSGSFNGERTTYADDHY